MLIEVNNALLLAKTACLGKIWFQIYRSENAKNGQNRDLSWYISNCRDQSYMVFRIENGGNSSLVLLKTLCVQSLSFQSYSLAKGPEKLIFPSLQYISKSFSSDIPIYLFQNNLVKLSQQISFNFWYVCVGIYVLRFGEKYLLKNCPFPDLQVLTGKKNDQHYIYMSECAINWGKLRRFVIYLEM